MFRGEMPLTVLEMLQQRVSDNQLGDFMEEIQALDGMLDKMPLKTPYNPKILCLRGSDLNFL